MSAAAGSVAGGSLVAQGVTESQCLDLCLMNSFCLAVDYNSNELGCYLHASSTYCNTVVALTGVTHYKKVPCLTSKNNFTIRLFHLVECSTGVVNQAREVRLMFHVLGGSLLCTGCDLQTCLRLCYASTTCQGVDFDTRWGNYFE
jgi:hypothetical protein